MRSLAMFAAAAVMCASPAIITAGPPCPPEVNEEGDVVVLLADERVHAAIRPLVEGGGERTDRPAGPG